MQAGAHEPREKARKTERVCTTHGHSWRKWAKPGAVGSLMEDWGQRPGEEDNRVFMHAAPTTEVGTTRLLSNRTLHPMAATRVGAGGYIYVKTKARCRFYVCRKPVGGSGCRCRLLNCSPASSHMVVYVEVHELGFSILRDENLNIFTAASNTSQKRAWWWYHARHISKLNGQGRMNLRRMVAVSWPNSSSHGSIHPSRRACQGNPFAKRTGCR